MAGASKRRGQKQRQGGQSSKVSSDKGSLPPAPSGFDGPSDPAPTPSSVTQSRRTGPTGGGDAGSSITPYINKRLELPHAAYHLFSSVSVSNFLGSNILFTRFPLDTICCFELSLIFLTPIDLPHVLDHKA